MIKLDELGNPTSCLNKAHDNEMMFVLLARDAAAPAAIRQWIKERIVLGLNKVGDEQLRNAELTAQVMERGK